MKRLLLIAVLSGFLFAPLFPRQDTIYPKKIITTAEAIVPPEIDGFINDKAWEGVPWEGGFQMYDPYDDRPATQETRFKVIFDREHIYVAIRAYDTAPDSIVRRLTRRDDLDGDRVAFFFDSYHDLQTSFAFIASAAGSRMDVYLSDDGNNMDDTWNAIWWVKTQVDDLGWTMEAKVPFSQLRFDKKGDGIWGFQVLRHLFRTDETSLWQPKSKESAGWTTLFGELHGLQHINPKKQADITPYAVAGSNWFEKDEENPFRKDGFDRNLNAGLDAKMGITNNFTLDMTINPDFGQVEADPSQVNLTAYETFFEEQRPFFIEGKNIFDFDMAIHNMDNLFYSRRIGRRPHHNPDLGDGEYADRPEFTNILGAAKITGKTRGGLSLGIMESVTSKEMAEIDQSGDRRFVTVEPLTNYLAGRISKEFDKGNTIIGGMVTSTNRFGQEAHLDYLHSSAYSGGIDFKQYFSDRRYILSFSSYMSQVNGSEQALINTQRSSVHYFQRPDAEYLSLDSSRRSLSGYGGKLEFGKQSGNFKFMSFLNVSSPGLELNDLGFMSSADEIIQILWLGYRFNEPFGIFRWASINLNQWNVWDFGGNHQVAGVNMNGQAQFKNLWYAGFYMDTESEARSNSALRGGPSLIIPGGFSSSLWVSTNSTKKFEVEVDGMYYHGYDQWAKMFGIEMEMTYKPISNLNFSITPEFTHRHKEMQYVTQKHFTDIDRYLFGTISQNTLSMSLRADLIITPELTIQFWGQPFIASGDYSDFKYITDPVAGNFHERFRTFANNEIAFDPVLEEYRVTEAGSGLDYTFGNPDFNIKEFLSNLVFRWEYRPGSYIYLVWSQSRSGHDPHGRFRFNDDFSDIWDIHPSDAILLKVSYRIGR